jgi:Zn-dependent metalloprotease
MNRILMLGVLLVFLTTAAYSQSAKTHPPVKGQVSHSEPLRVSWPGKAEIPPAENPFQLPTPTLQPIGALQNRAGNAAPKVRIERDAAGHPIAFDGSTEVSRNLPEATAPDLAAMAYLTSLNPEGIQNPELEFVVTAQRQDAKGNQHVRVQQVYQNLEVYGGELTIHSRNGVFDLATGRYKNTPSLSSLTPALSEADALEQVKAALPNVEFKTNWTDMDLQVVGGSPVDAQLLVYNNQLVWHLEVHPNLMRRYIFFVDAQTGAILNQYDHTCSVAGTGHSHNDPKEKPEVLDGPVTANGLDLFNINRSFGAWQAGSFFYMEDASKPMFNNSASNMPSDPVGTIITLDALNTSPEVSSSFNYQLVSSGSLTFNHKKAVSAHYNSIKCYDYFKNTFNRNSINGLGGNILSFVNVSEANGSSMENAFWNGDAMWYGNGGSTFKELARGLDVGGHEMTHGVVEKTANLEYQYESGALNESFADIFGAMIDRDDWKIGEDVMQPGQSPGGCLRDLSNPHNNASQGSNWWQPNHVNEQYNGSLDNGGVHINSGIPNHAFYLFANNAAVGKDKAEQVYYIALTDYLVKSSQFVDLRIAVIAAATAEYGTTVANAAAAAFDQVGIVGNAPGGNYLGQLSVNPGDDYALCVTQDLNDLDLATGAGTILGTLYDQGVASRPSITDNGSQIVFVNEAGHIIGIDLAYTNGQINFSTSTLSNAAEWRNAAISKDGRYIAGLTSTANNLIYVFDLLSIVGDFEVFELYNPTYTQGQITGEVQYADVLEFDYSGNFIMYDAFNELSNNQGEDISYWDIGFIQFWENNAFTNGSNAFISKLFNGIPEKTSIGNPAFAKNSPFVIAFDYIDNLNGQYDIYGANVETGDYDVIIQDNGDLGWPNYNRTDNALLTEYPGFLNYNLYLEGLNPDKISSSGQGTGFVDARVWGVWFANGNRSLQVDAKETILETMDIRVSPNPGNGWVKVQLESASGGPIQIQLVDMLGRTILQQQKMLQSGTNTFDLDFQSQANGTYWLRLSTGTEMGVLQLIKQ